jgi:hypothetical protein
MVRQNAREVVDNRGPGYPPIRGREVEVRLVFALADSFCILAVAPFFHAMRLPRRVAEEQRAVVGSVGTRGDQHPDAKSVGLSSAQDLRETFWAQGLPRLKPGVEEAFIRVVDVGIRDAQAADHVAELLRVFFCCFMVG